MVTPETRRVRLEHFLLSKLFCNNLKNQHLNTALWSRDIVVNF
jgi:hypothetical protein